MALLWNIVRKTAAKALRNCRLPSGSISETGVRALSSRHVLENIVTSSLSDVQQPHGNLINTIFENVHRWGSKTAVECSETGRMYTYNQVLDGISKWAGFLTKLGLNKGDVIAVNMVNCPEYPIVLLGAISIGVIVTTVNHNYTAEEIVRQLNDSAAQLLVGEPLFEATILGSLALYKRPLHLVMNGPSSAPEALNLQEILKDTTIPYADIAELTGKELAAMPYSSGTTGLPKGVTVSHNAFSMNIRMCSHPAVFSAKYTTDVFQESFLCLLPFYHMYGIFVIMMMGLHAGAKLITLSKFELNQYISSLRKNKVEILHLVPPLLNFLIHSPAATPKNLASIKTIIIGAAPVAASSAVAFKDKIGKDIFIQEGYGMTEVLITNTVPLGEERIGTSGKLLSNVSAKIIDTDTGENLPSTKIGEICLKTPAMMSGYFQNEAATSSTIDNEGWLHSGDVGYFDDDGFLKVVDRTKELIKVKALQVSPSELEDVLRQHPQVLDVGVVGVPHDRNGEAPRAYVVTKKQISEEDIHRFLESRVAPHKKLAGGLAFVKELPKTATGKILRRELKKMALG